MKSKLIANLRVIEKKTEWYNTLDDIGYYDFYHTYDYHYLSKLGDEKAVLLKYTEGNKVICFPFLIRKINDTDYFDATSVYGYAGPLQKNLDKNFDNSFFSKALNNYFVQEKIVSVFSRLNPFIINQEQVLKNIGQTKELGNVVNIDLTLPLDEQRAAYSKITKRYINKCRRQCQIIRSNCPSHIDSFVNLYYENMDRVNAKEHYYFSKDYFLKFVNSNDYETDILFAILKDTDEIISAALMVKTNDVVQYHLSGTKAEFLDLSPIRLLIDEMRIIAKNEDKTFFNLGGGLGNSDDGLFRFKSSFSKDFKPFKIWKHIINKKVYDSLVEEYMPSDCDCDLDFFPLYRCNGL
ncbi:peptidoglycan bridge formation glycyltransferase FemA/FemB family protein [Flavivirga algicola]|uniref:Aminoacyltransferase n=1 Tax=Flavivirga algicola TaxID=2729136 RepID=A0ABX1S0Q6_9FLAO|nr:peptidoglycan bridge formation glycyltransferase FemA/FemB family protein [Flavivirga algicola]NMH88207.1 aminoacyltransferase [Flavivirga algicola]